MRLSITNKGREVIRQQRIEGRKLTWIDRLLFDLEEGSRKLDELREDYANIFHGINFDNFINALVTDGLIEKSENTLKIIPIHFGEIKT